MQAWLQLATLVAILLLLYRPLGSYLARVYTSSSHLRVERVIYRAAGVDPQREQPWGTYALCLLAFSLASTVVLFLILRVQGSLPGSLDLPGMEGALAFNTAASFVTNTNWQAYAGESTLGYLAQMSGLAVQNFVSAAVGIAVAIALIRGVTRREARTIGNFWVDLVRTLVRVLLPISFVVALAFVAQGLPQSLADPMPVTTLDGGSQTIMFGPVASQESIKDLGTNGGGFFNANSAHPYENPTPLTNLAQIVLMLAIPFALANTFGRMTGQPRQGRVLAAVMAAFWLGSVLLAWHFESRAPPAVEAAAHVNGGNLVGKEVRFGVPATSAYAASTTGTSTGSVTGSHDSFTPGGGAVTIGNIMLSEVTPGGVGSGLYGMLVLAILAVFIAGLMVGRTPEYLGKRIEPKEMKVVSLYILLVPALVLMGAAVAISLPVARSSILNPGPHGLTEVLYAFTSAANNNGSAFGGLAANTPFYNLALGVAMLIGRFGSIVLVLALAGSLASKRTVAESEGTFPTHGLLFGGLLAGTIILITGLTYFPALSLGPLAEGLS